MSKKNIILIIIVIVLLALVSLGIGFWLEQRTQKELLGKSNTFVSLWGNYTDPASNTYLDSITPYVSDSVIAEYRSSANEIIVARSANPPATSTFTIKEEATIKKNKKAYDTVVVGTRKYSFDDTSIDQTVYMHWEKVDGKYLITEVYTDK